MWSRDFSSIMRGGRRRDEERKSVRQTDKWKDRQGETEAHRWTETERERKKNHNKLSTTKILLKSFQKGYARLPFVHFHKRHDEISKHLTISCVVICVVFLSCTCHPLPRQNHHCTQGKRNDHHALSKEK